MSNLFKSLIQSADFISVKCFQRNVPKSDPTSTKHLIYDLKDEQHRGGEPDPGGDDGGLLAPQRGSTRMDSIHGRFIGLTRSYTYVPVTADSDCASSGVLCSVCCVVQI